MRVRALLPVLMLTLLAACATPFRANVSRFQSLPAPTGQTFFVQAQDRTKAGGLEFSNYANLVRERLLAAGYQQAPSANAATLVVNFDYGVNDGREKVATRPGTGFGYSRFGYGGFGYGGFGWPHYGFYGRHLYRPFGYYGFYDPFFGPFDEPEVYSYTVYNAHVAMRINRANTGESVFEGRAETAARTNNLTQLVPNLVEAMFTNFPGRSGETVRVTLQPEKRRG